jgi:ATP-dependent RNA helicase DHX29
VYLQTRVSLLRLERSQQESGKKSNAGGNDAHDSLELAKLQAKLDRIERDVLFDKFVADQQWRAKRIELEKEFAAAKKQKAREAEESAAISGEDGKGDTDGDVNSEAERIAGEILAEAEDDDDTAVADLFASLPVSEVDAATGKTRTVINEKDGSRTIIRDFGKWTGVSPMRILEEACRLR